MNLLTRLLDKPRTLRLRGWLFQVHLWTGIIAGLYAFAIGVTGSILVFREEIADWESASFSRFQPSSQRPYATPDEWLAAARKAAGPKLTLNFTFPEKHGDPLIAGTFSPAGSRRYFFDPYTAQLLGVHARTGGVLTFMEHLHHNLLLGRTGRLWNGIGALSLLLLSITGIVIWWPGRRLWRRRLIVDPKASWKRINFDVHHVVGFWGLAGFALLCITGAWFTWPQFFRDTVARFYPVTKPQPPPKVTHPPGTQPLPLAKLIEAADRAVPGKITKRASIPPPGTQPVRINKGSADDGQPFFRTATTLTLNPYTAEVLRIEGPHTKAAGDRILSWMGPLHFGNFGGAPVKWIYFFLGLTMPVLFVSGFIMWWQRVVRRRLERIRQPDQRSHAPAQPVIVELE
ncbi:MAG: PepSY domain-containing protein [Bryobacterales bacterium]|nr:PepSY domain-containing protein [Bryobacterales bacterium]